MSITDPSKRDIDLTREVWRYAEVADYLRISTRTVHTLVKAGKLPVLRLGRKVLFHRDQLLEHLRKQGSVHHGESHPAA